MKKLNETWKNIGKIVTIMYVFTALLLFFLAALVQRFQWEAGATAIGVEIIYAIVCGFGGFFVGKVQKNRKFLWGLLMGLIYVLLMMGITLLFKKQVDESLRHMVLNSVICLGSGMLGGMIS